MLDRKLEDAAQKFKSILRSQLDRIEQMKQGLRWTDFSIKSKIIIGVCGGDGIGPIICAESRRILEAALSDAVASGRVEFKTIDGLTIENRVLKNQAIPDDVLAELKACDVILKGPTTTPQKGDNWPNIESANVAMRRELDLFGNVRPVRVANEGVDWTFFRENTEGEYVLGSKGIDVSEDLSVDFKVTTEQGSERIIRLAFEFAKANGKKRVTVVTKSNVIKTTDGRFSAVAKRIAAEYQDVGITCDEWYIDIMTAKLLDPARRNEFEVMVMPNLYGDIITDEAAQIQGGVGTAGSANVGSQWAMFEAIHGSAPRMITDGRGQFADPSSMIKASAMLARHIGFADAADRIDRALEICVQFERRHIVTGRPDGVTAAEFSNYVMEWIDNPELIQAYDRFSQTK